MHQRVGCRRASQVAPAALNGHNGFMCGRYTQRKPTLVIVRRFQAEQQTELWPARYNIAPTQTVQAIRCDEGTDHKRKIVKLRWGLIPFPSYEGSLLINARAETVAEKPAFRHAFKSRRCLIIADGFYEWSLKNKQPHFFHLADDRPFAFAGLRSTVTEAKPSEHREGSCVFLTTTANDVVAPVHDRMPVILEGEATHTWLDPDASQETLLALLKPFEGDLIAQTVSKLVNNPRNENAECIEPE
jgi:putative SOS response-associated peptidase YedK